MTKSVPPVPEAPLPSELLNVLKESELSAEDIQHAKRIVGNCSGRHLPLAIASWVAQLRQALAESQQALKAKTQMLEVIAGLDAIGKQLDSASAAYDLNAMAEAAEQALAQAECDRDAARTKWFTVAETAKSRAEAAEQALAKSQAEAEDWQLAADGIKHHFHCANNAVTGDPRGLICDRCRAEAAEARVSALEAALGEVKDYALLIEAGIPPDDRPRQRPVALAPDTDPQP